MSYLETFIFGTGMGFLYNFPPRKIQLLFLGASVVVLIIFAAIIMDSGKSLIPSSYDWMFVVFNLMGYIVGFACAKGMRLLIGVDWR